MGKTPKEILNSLRKWSKIHDSDDLSSSWKSLIEYFELKDQKAPKVVENSHLPLPQLLNGKELVSLYTDGACRGNPGVGSFAYLIQNAQSDVLAQGGDFLAHTTNNQMEIQAVIAGLKRLKLDFPEVEEVAIFSDSRYVVDGITKWVHGWERRGWKKADGKSPENLILWQELTERSREFTTHFHWVKGHSGMPQNEFCDRLANEILDSHL